MCINKALRLFKAFTITYVKILLKDTEILIMKKILKEHPNINYEKKKEKYSKIYDKSCTNVRRFLSIDQRN